MPNLPDDLVTQAEAARLTGRTRQSVHLLIQRGRIACYGRDRLVSLADVAGYVAVSEGGRPRKKNPGQR